MRGTITLGQMLCRMKASDRILVVDESEKEYFRGYVYGSEEEVHSIRDVPVVSFSIHTDIFPKEKREERLRKTEKNVLPVDRLTEFELKSLDLIIYAKIVLENEQRRTEG